LIIRELAVGPIQANCFILGCEETQNAVVIDPGGDTDRILMTLAQEKLKVIYILNTHGHFDHVAGNRKMKEVTGAKLMIHPLDAPMLDQLSIGAAAFGLSAENSPPADEDLNDGDTLKFGNHELKVVHTPGHSPGGVAFAIQNYLFVGDTLFAGSIGRTDLPGGDFNTLITNVKTKLFAYDDSTTVFCGHGPKTTIGTEKKYNPFVHL